MKKSKCRMQLWGMLGCILLTTACKQTNEQPLAGGNYETMKVTVSNQELNTAYSATIRGRQDIDIYPQVSGTIQDKSCAWPKAKRYARGRRSSSSTKCPTGRH